MLYFAYGSNMAEARLKRRIPSAFKIGVANLPGHQLTFHNASTKDGSAKCDAFRTGGSEDLVVGVLFRMAPTEKAILDRYEGLGVEYRDAFVPVSLDGGGVEEALIYYATNIDPSLLPYHWYKEHVVRGAVENVLPEDYILRIESVVSVDDPDPQRHAMELRIYL